MTWARKRGSRALEFKGVFKSDWLGSPTGIKGLESPMSTPNEKPRNFSMSSRSWGGGDRRGRRGRTPETTPCEGGLPGQGGDARRATYESHPTEDRAPGTTKHAPERAEPRPDKRGRKEVDEFSCGAPAENELEAHEDERDREIPDIEMTIELIGEGRSE